ncbi:MAG: hypothetical protein ACKVJ6_06920, partial [Flavobacteriales bacterium]
MNKCWVLLIMLCSTVSHEIFCQICPYPTITVELTTFIWAEETSWTVINEENDTVAGPFNGFINDTIYMEVLCLEPGCYTALLEDSYGDGWHGGSISFTSSLGELLSTGTVSGFSSSLEIHTDPLCGTIECAEGSGDLYFATLSPDLYGEELSWGIVDSEGTHVA